MGGRQSGLDGSSAAMLVCCARIKQAPSAANMCAAVVCAPCLADMQRLS